MKAIDKVHKMIQRVITHVPKDEDRLITNLENVYSLAEYGSDDDDVYNHHLYIDLMNVTSKIITASIPKITEEWHKKVISCFLFSEPINREELDDDEKLFRDIMVNMAAEEFPFFKGNIQSLDNNVKFLTKVALEYHREVSILEDIENL